MEDKEQICDSSSSDDEPLSKVARRKISQSSDDEPLAAKQRTWAQLEDLDDSDNDPDYCIAKDTIDSSDSNIATSEDEALSRPAVQDVSSLPYLSGAESTSQPTSTAEHTLLPWKSTAENMPLPSECTIENMTLPSTSTAENMPLPSESTIENMPLPSTSTAENMPLPSESMIDNMPLPSTSTAENTPLPSESTIENMPLPSTSTAEGISLSSSSTAHPTNTSVFDTPKKRSRKRQGNPAKWKKSVRKSLCQTGQAYVSAKGKTVPKREVREISCEQCKFKCGEKFSQDEREQLHSDYWSIESRERKYDYICQNIEETKPERQEKTRKTSSRKYFFPHPTTHDRIRVCKKFFLKTLDISDQTVNGPLKKQRVGLAQSTTDGRGKHVPHNKTRDGDLQAVREHIESFPALESHYCRKDSKRQYLESNLNIKKMHKLYIKHMEHKGEGERVVSEQVYRKVFNMDYNLAFHKPKKDQCKHCRLYDRSTNPTIQEKKDYAAHHERKRAVRASKDADKERAEKDATFVSCTFDMEKVLQAPSGLVGPLYYKRKLNCYNLCVHSMADKTGHCFFWNETTGQKGSSEVATVLVKYLSDLPKEVSHVTFYCDTCGGQNRNAAVVSALNYVVRTSETICTIDLKFMESGHSHMEVDSMHSAIEGQKAVTELFVPSEWVNLFKTARQRDPYNVIVMQPTDFLDFKSYAKANLRNTKKDMTGRQIQWLKTKWFRFLKNEPDIVFFKENITDTEFRRMKVSKKEQRGRQSMNNAHPVVKYSGKLSISPAKKKDLLSLCTSGIVPEEFVPFFEKLSCDSAIKDTIQTRDEVDASTDEEDIN